MKHIDEIIKIGEKVRYFINVEIGYSETYCGISSCFLLKELKKNKIKAEIGENCNHAFIVFKDKNLILDITADQFDPRLPEVCVTTINSTKKIEKGCNVLNNNQYYWTIDHTFKNVTNFVGYQIANCWPDQQILNESLEYNYKKFFKKVA